MQDLRARANRSDRRAGVACPGARWNNRRRPLAHGLSSWAQFAAPDGDRKRAELRVRNERLGQALTRLAVTGAIVRAGDRWDIPVPIF